MALFTFRNPEEYFEVEEAFKRACEAVRKEGFGVSIRIYNGINDLNYLPVIYNPINITDSIMTLLAEYLPKINMHKGGVNGVKLEFNYHNRQIYYAVYDMNYNVLFFKPKNRMGGGIIRLSHSLCSIRDWDAKDVKKDVMKKMETILQDCMRIVEEFYETRDPEYSED